MIILPLLVLLSSSVFAAETVECEENKISLEATTLAENFAGKDCTKDMEVRHLNAKILRPESAKKFCKECVVTPLGSEQSKADKEKYVSAVVGEFKKELTYISQDLLKIAETSFKLDSTLSCNLNQLLPKSICENGKEPVGKIIDSLQEALGNELADTFKPNKTPLDGLVKRNPLACNKMDKYEVSDQGILAARTKYLESLLTPEFILELNNGFQKDDNFRIDQLTILNTHPVFKEIGSNPEELKKFVSSALKAKDNNEIIKLMNKTAKAENFSKKFALRCQSAIEKVSTAFKTIYCEDTVLFSEDKFGIEKVNNYKNVPLEKNHFKLFCLDLNKSESEKDQKSFNFSQFANELTKNIPDDKKDESWSTFHNDTHRALYHADKDAICNLMPPSEPGCDDAIIKDTQHCQMLKFLKDADKPDEANMATKESRESVNSIFRSMLSGAKFDPGTQKTLQEAGILPGGEPEESKSAGYFYDKSSGQKVSSSTMPAFSNDKNSTKVPFPTVGKKDSENVTNPGNFTNVASNTIPSNNSISDEAGSSNSKFNTKFDDNQQSLVDRLMRSKKGNKVTSKDEKVIKNEVVEKKSKLGQKKDKDDDFFENGSFTTDQSGGMNEETSMARLPSVKSGVQAGKHAVIDPKKVDKNASLNEAKIQAQTRSPASTDVVKNTTISLSKTEKGLNKIEIKVPDESILATKTPELEVKIQEYLDKSGPSLQGAQKGEAFIVKLGKYDIKVAINDHGVYEASCADKTIHPEYLAFLTKYFRGIKDRVNSRESMDKIIKSELQSNK